MEQRITYTESVQKWNYKIAKNCYCKKWQFVEACYTQTGVPMEQPVTYTFFYYGGYLLNGVSIYEATGTNLQQKLLF
jgi:hypothetical protein